MTYRDTVAQTTAGVVAIAMTLATACSAPAEPLRAAHPDRLTGDKSMAEQHAQTGLITVTGTRLTMGDAVECPRIRSEDGQTHGVYRLAASIAIGDRVRVTGRMGNVPTCLGPVIIPEDVQHLD